MELTKKSELLIAPEYLKALEQVGVANPHLYCILTYAMRNMNADNVCKTTVGLLADELSFSTKRINIELSNALIFASSPCLFRRTMMLSLYFGSAGRIAG